MLKILWKEISESEVYASYMTSRTGTFEEDKEFGDRDLQKGYRSK